MQRVPGGQQLFDTLLTVFSRVSLWAGCLSLDREQRRKLLPRHQTLPHSLRRLALARPKTKRLQLPISHISNRKQRPASRTWKHEPYQFKKVLTPPCMSTLIRCMRSCSQRCRRRQWSSAESGPERTHHYSCTFSQIATARPALGLTHAHHAHAADIRSRLSIMAQLLHGGPGLTTGTIRSTCSQSTMRLSRVALKQFLGSAPASWRGASIRTGRA
jgi:hypothetical protein